jgi:hypothetical protein
MFTCHKVALVGLVLAWHAAAVAQDYLPPGVGVNAYGQYYSCHTGGSWNNPTSAWLGGEIAKQNMNQLLFNNMVSNAIFNEMVRAEARRIDGQAKMNAGLATTSFVSSREASTLQQWLNTAQGQAEQQAQMASLQQNLLDFEAALTRHGCRLRNLADAVALGFVINYAALRDQDPGAERLSKFKGELEAAWLVDPYWIGYSDAERQAQYEFVAINSMVAIAARAESKRPGLKAEQVQRLVQIAKSSAETFFQRYWTKPVSGLELTATGFGDRGQRLVEAGTGHAEFVPGPDSGVVREYANRWSFLFAEQPVARCEALKREFDGLVKAAGGSTRNCADANAVAFALCYQLCHATTPPLNPTQIRWLRGEMLADLKGSEEFQRLDDAGRQKLYDTLAMDVMLARYRVLTAQKDIDRPLPDDPFERYSALMLQSSAISLRDSALSDCSRQMHAIFSPRRLADYELRPNGFALLGAAAVVQQPLPAAHSTNGSTNAGGTTQPTPPQSGTGPASQGSPSSGTPKAQPQQGPAPARPSASGAGAPR